MIETNVAYIPRDSYIRRIRPYIDSHIIKALTGRRRAGKSYILYQLIDELRQTMDDGPPRQSPRGIRWMNLKDFLAMDL